MVQLVAPTFLGCWALIAPVLSFIFSKMITLFFFMWWHMLRQAFSPSNWHYGIFKFYYPKLSNFRSSFWESCGIVLSSLINFFDEPLIQGGIFHTSNKCSFKPPIFHKSNYKCLVISPSYHIYRSNSNAWLLTHPTTFTFCLVLDHFLDHFLTMLVLALVCHILLLHIFHIINVDIPLMV